MYLEELSSYKKELMKLLISDKDIVSLITGDSASVTPAYNLIYSAIIPYEIPEGFSTDISTYICFNVDVLAVNSKTLLSPALNLWVFSRLDALRLEDDSVLPDKLSSKIDVLLNGSHLFGLGSLELFSVGRYAPSKEYVGHILTYHAKEFNRGKALPPSTKRTGQTPPVISHA